MLANTVTITVEVPPALRESRLMLRWHSTYLEISGAGVELWRSHVGTELCNETSFTLWVIGSLLLLWHMCFYCFFSLFCYSFLLRLWSLLGPSVPVCASANRVCREQRAGVSRVLIYLGPHLLQKCHKSKSQHVKLSVSRYLCKPETAASVNSQRFTLPVRGGTSALVGTRTFWVWRHFNQPHCATDRGSESPELALALAQTRTLNDITDSKLITLASFISPEHHAWARAASHPRTCQRRGLMSLGVRGPRVFSSGRPLCALIPSFLKKAIEPVLKYFLDKAVCSRGLWEYLICNIKGSKGKNR